MRPTLGYLGAIGGTNALRKLSFDTMISVFATVSPASKKPDCPVAAVVEMIRSTKFKEQTDYLRSLTNPDAAKIYKAGARDEQGRLTGPGHFWGVTWAGIFEGGKKAENLVQHSGLLCMDVDNLAHEEVSKLIGLLRADPYTHVLFVSPSGNGLKWVVKIGLKHPDEHKLFFQQLANYLHDAYRLTRREDVPNGTKPQIDASGCNVDRLCFLPYDPEAYYNLDSKTMPLLAEYRLDAQSVGERSQRQSQTQNVPDDDTHRRIDDYLQRLHQFGVDLTANYEDWVKIGLAFASLGEEGRSAFHEASRLHPKYTYQETETKFSELLRNRNGQVNIGTFFHLVDEVLGKPQSRQAKDGSLGNEQAENAKQYEEWPEPEPLTTPLLSVLSVSPPSIPEKLRPWVLDIATRMKCPLDYVASAAIVMLSSLIGTRLTIKPKQKDNWTVVPNLWGAVIGDPSTMKTPSVSEVFKPLKLLARQAAEDHKQRLLEYEAQHLQYETQRKLYQKQEQDRLLGKSVKTFISYPTEPQKPTEKRYWTNDVTVEKLAELLNDNPTGLLIERDELTGLLAGWDRSGREQDRAFYLEAWNGNGTQTVDRIGRGTIHVPNLCVSLFGGIQPAKLLGYLQAATGFDNDGFVQRLQLAVYPDKPQWQYTDEYPDKHARDTAYEVIQSLATTDLTKYGYEADEYNRYPYTHFDNEAQEIFKSWLIDWEINVLSHETGLLLEHFTKYRSLVPSLALIFHLISCVEGESSTASSRLVSAQAVRMALDWCTYLQSHARRIYGLLDTASTESAKELLKHLKAGDLSDKFKARDVQRKGWKQLINESDVDAALYELTLRHWLKEVPALPTGKGRPEGPCYLIHPSILLKTYR
ncbi:DUF3987 domain-containing protein [Fibrisoma montanum]|uniref:DUF3987 domain-containing protein n=1 Tax=Fibrisoma montanum TaxID=2305895 RepID=A0A418M1K4_9BACT|nr:DUF3987 domain-containing protein [Fibrisoma montanum]RIV19416.1 DUF3987 domain-containing protein [Fibrisoma montanum]